MSSAGACSAGGVLIAGIRSDQWLDPMPCSEWNVRDVVNHLVGMNLVFASLLDGGPVPERAADHLGDNALGAYQSSAAALHDAFGRPGVVERSYAGPLGDATGAERLQIRLYDLLAHGWDLVQATGSRTSFSATATSRTSPVAEAVGRHAAAPS